MTKSTNQNATPKGYRIIDPQLVRQMRSVVRKQTDESLTDQFGVSYNTWRKLLAGGPIRASLADRLEERLRRP